MITTPGSQTGLGEAEAVEALIHLIVQHRGFGEHLAGGSLALARRYGAEDEAVQVNGLEAAYHDPRGFSGNALVYATSPRGACHNQSDYFLAETGQLHTCLGMESFHPLGGAEKANVAGTRTGEPPVMR
jgi:aldehyde:ferredoxin oxidoreductase